MSTVIEMAAMGLLALGLTRGATVWRGTTLEAPRRWCFAAVLGLVLVEGLIAWFQPGTAERQVWRLAADMLLATPLVALLGAKRPQDRGWYWIVLALWITLLVPCAQWWVFGQGSFRLPLSWQLLVIVLAVLPAANYWGTTQRWSATAWSIGQLVMVSPVLSVLAGSPLLTNPTWAEWSRPLGVGSLAASMWLANHVAAGWARRGQGWNRVWADFRDAYGAAWGLRAMERINQTARAARWPVRLSWAGGLAAATATAEDEPARRETDAALASEIDLAMRTALRRFVSPEWLDQRTEQVGSA